MENTSVRHNIAEGRFEITVENQTAVLQYRQSGGTIRLIHTEVPPELRGRGLASQLARAALDYAHFNRLRAIPICPFVKAYLEKHPEAAG
jgi:predicted GNAT family acetyltransferase